MNWVARLWEEEGLESQGGDEGVRKGIVVGLCVSSLLNAFATSCLEVVAGEFKLYGKQCGIQNWY